MFKMNAKIETNALHSYMTSADVNVFGIVDLTNSRTDASVGSDSLVLSWMFPSEKTTA